MYSVYINIFQFLGHLKIREQIEVRLHTWKKKPGESKK